jgi:S-adenosylmethionine hydrolase
VAIITLTTDFGERDHYVGVMRGVLLQIAPKATLVDITHDIPAHDVVRAAFVVRQAWPWFPPGTVHLIVVDPGVGTARRILAGRYDGQFFVAPDNGVISMVHHAFRPEGIHVVEGRPRVAGGPSATFHGRDIMAPVAAALATQPDLRRVGPPTDHLEVLAMPGVEHRSDRTLAGEVVYVDGFGNCVTNISRVELAAVLMRDPRSPVFADGIMVGPVHHAYAEVPLGAPVPIIGSSEMLEIAVNRGSAQDVLNLNVGSKIIVGGKSLASDDLTEPVDSVRRTTTTSHKRDDGQGQQTA